MTVAAPRLWPWAPLFLCQREARPSPGLTDSVLADRGQRVATVSAPDHPARLIFPRVLRLLVRMDWATPVEGASRIRSLPQLCAVGDYEATLYKAGITHPDTVTRATELDALPVCARAPPRHHRPPRSDRARLPGGSG